ncbi:hypothetical protein PHMEG_0008267 [Phytophthora megakarya]|uniref:Reverse transcriptase n=1 Tax=Phytophthora megakarya TaxID=4795 RepID=A0A225WKW0_9STRA|nr:hypothetical protein PHMEG_0008267 [Phytophthora megakarya]
MSLEEATVGRLPSSDLLLQIDEHGIDAEWKQCPQPQRTPPKITVRVNDIFMQSQKAFKTVKIDVSTCPLGAVDKKEISLYDEVRTIHDLSFPKTRSNQFFRMAAIGYVIIDLAAPFGWAGSLPWYTSFGRAISWLMDSNSPAAVSSSVDHNPFFAYQWVDDHIVVESKVANRLHLAEATLRHTMQVVLGPRALSYDYYGILHVERYQFHGKIIMARKRVSEILTRGRASKTEFYKVL